MPVTTAPKVASSGLISNEWAIELPPRTALDENLSDNRRDWQLGRGSSGHAASSPVRCLLPGEKVSRTELVGVSANGVYAAVSEFENHVAGDFEAKSPFHWEIRVEPTQDAAGDAV